MSDSGIKMAGKVKLGDLRVNRLGFGAMRITGQGVWGEPDDREKAKQVLKRAVELGVDFIDTADAYGPEVSERLICEALHPYDGIVIATKGGLTRGGPGQWTPDCSPEHLREAIDGSLQRLQLDRIDLYQLHTVDPNVDFAKSYQTLLDLQNEGKIRHIGLSNIEPEHFKQALEMGQFVSVQNNYSVFNREHEDVLELCADHKIAFIPYFPMGGNRSEGASHEVLSGIAKDHEATDHQVALAWLLQHSEYMLPIPGTGSLEHLEENVAAADLVLSQEEIAKLDSISS